MSLCHNPPSVEQINRSHHNTAVSQMGIELTEVGDDYLVARMPVDARQPRRLGDRPGNAEPHRAFDADPGRAGD